MPVQKSELKKALGRLVSAIQKEWHEEAGEDYAEKSEKVMYAAHNLLQAESIDRVRSTLGALSVEQYIDSSWVSAHPNVRDAIALVEEQLADK